MKGKTLSPTRLPAHTFTLQHHSQNTLCTLHHCASVLVSLCPRKSHFCLARANLICHKIILLPCSPGGCTLQTGVFLSSKMAGCPTTRKYSKYTNALNQIYNSTCLNCSVWEWLGRGRGTGSPFPPGRSRIWNSAPSGWTWSVTHCSLGHSARTNLLPLVHSQNHPRPHFFGTKDPPNPWCYYA